MGPYSLMLLCLEIYCILTVEDVYRWSLTVVSCLLSQLCYWMALHGFQRPVHAHTISTLIKKQLVVNKSAMKTMHKL